MKEKKPKKAATKKPSKYNTVFKFSGNPDAALNAMLNPKQPIKKK